MVGCEELNIRKCPSQSLSYKDRVAGFPSPCQQEAQVQRSGASVCQLWFSMANVCLQSTFQPELYMIYTLFYLSLDNFNPTQPTLVYGPCYSPGPSWKTCSVGSYSLYFHLDFPKSKEFPPPKYPRLEERILGWALLCLFASSRLLFFLTPFSSRSRYCCQITSTAPKQLPNESHLWRPAFSCPSLPTAYKLLSIRATFKSIWLKERQTPPHPFFF